MQDENNIKSTAIPRHFLFLDGLRALAALYVLGHHACMYVNYAKDSVAGNIASIFAYGHSAVNLFIIISGFCLMLPILQNNGVLKGGVWHFYRKRAKRILPPYFITVITCILLIHTFLSQKTGTQWDGTFPINAWDVFTRTVLLQDVFANTQAKINYPLWSISVEFRIYLLFPLLLLCWRKWGVIPLTIACTLLSLAIWAIMVQNPLFNISRSGINPHYLVLFVAGMWACYFSYSNQPKIAYLRSKCNIWLVGALTLLVFVLLTYFKYYYHQHIIKLPAHAFRDLKEGLLMSVFLFLIATGRLHTINSIVSWKPLAAIGLFSYSIYLMHAPFLQIVMQYGIFPFGFSSDVQMILLLLAGTPVVLLLSYLFYLFAEKPFMTRKKTATKTVDAKLQLSSQNA